MNDDLTISNMEVVDGQLVETSSRTINPQQCPHFIMVSRHYRDDGSCRCDDPEHSEMSEWGYEWDDGEYGWVSPESDDDD